MKDSKYRSNGKLLYRRFMLFLFPSVIAAVSVALSEFVDGIMVSNLAGDEGLAIVTLGSPVMYLISAFYMLLGSGGAIVYSTRMGEMKKDEAARAFLCAVFSAVLIGSLTCLIAIIFRGPITTLLSAGSGYDDELSGYLVYLFLSIPVVTAFVTFLMFLPSFGRPNLASAGILLANVINLTLDYVFIRILGLGIKGAALATLTGYIVAAIVITIIILCGKRKTEFPKISKDMLRFWAKDFKTLLPRGLPTAVGQMGFVILTMYCNNVAGKYGGNLGISILALCIQTQSIVSIVISGGCDSVVPIIALLSGQNDNNGVKLVVRKVAAFIGISVTALMLIFIIKPDWICNMYGTEDEAVRDGFYSAIRIFALYYPLRSLVVLYRDVINALGREKFSLLVSLQDGFVGIIFFSLILCSVYGLDGLWITYPVNALFTAAMIFVIVVIIKKRSKKKLLGIFMLPQEDADNLLNLEFMDENDSISEVSSLVEEFCAERDVKRGTAMKAGLLAEEMAVYTRAQKTDYPYINILIHMTDENIRMEFRSIGPGFQPGTAASEEEEMSLTLIKKLSASVEYEYAIGMNITRIMLQK
ncbi:MAG: hypothetical protein II688_04755 [Lachnospiraceae bacterium]|nr:hypothetical protein [Lachnospiraceae bacterium]